MGMPRGHKVQMGGCEGQVRSHLGEGHREQRPLHSAARLPHRGPRSLSWAELCPTPRWAVGALSPSTRECGVFGDRSTKGLNQ